jgi:DNA-binding ferritin-like protein
VKEKERCFGSFPMGHTKKVVKHDKIRNSDKKSNWIMAVDNFKEQNGKFIKDVRQLWFYDQYG